MPMPAGSGGVALVLFVSKERRVPKVRIENKQLQNFVKKRIVVAIDSSGHYIRTIGDIGDKKHKQGKVYLNFGVASCFKSV
jgi:exosome complex exonuclease DIS3/RRP44